jgi:hypothetical protein
MTPAEIRAFVNTLIGHATDYDDHLLVAMTDVPEHLQTAYDILMGSPLELNNLTIRVELATHLISKLVQLSEEHDHAGTK